MERVCGISELLHAYLEKERQRSLLADRQERQDRVYRERAREVGIDLDRPPLPPTRIALALRPLFDAAVIRYNESSNPFDRFQEGSSETSDLWKTFGRRLAAVEKERHRALFELMSELVQRMYDTRETAETAESEDEAKLERQAVPAHIDFW